MSQATLLFDGDCRFCRRWIRKWEDMTRESISYRPYQEALSSFPQVSEKDCKSAVQLILPDQKVYSGAHAVFKALALGGRLRWLLWMYEHVKIFARISESIYSLVAHHRTFFSNWI